MPSSCNWDKQKQDVVKALKELSSHHSKCMNMIINALSDVTLSSSAHEVSITLKDLCNFFSTCDKEHEKFRKNLSQKISDFEEEVSSSNAELNIKVENIEVSVKNEPNVEDKGPKLKLKNIGDLLDPSFVENRVPNPLSKNKKLLNNTKSSKVPKTDTIPDDFNETVIIDSSFDVTNDADFNSTKTTDGPETSKVPTETVISNKESILENSENDISTENTNVSIETKTKNTTTSDAEVIDTSFPDDKPKDNRTKPCKLNIIEQKVIKNSKTKKLSKTCAQSSENPSSDGENSLESRTNSKKLSTEKQTKRKKSSSPDTSSSESLAGDVDKVENGLKRLLEDRKVRKLGISRGSSSSTASLSSEEDTSSRQKIRIKRQLGKKLTPNDWKFKTECMVALPKQSVEELKSNYLIDLEDRTIESLVAMPNLSKKRKNRSASEANSSEDNVRKKKSSTRLQKASPKSKKVLTESESDSSLAELRDSNVSLKVDEPSQQFQNDLRNSTSEENDSDNNEKTLDQCESKSVDVVADSDSEVKKKSTSCHDSGSDDLAKEKKSTSCHDSGSDLAKEKKKTSNLDSESDDLAKKKKKVDSNASTDSELETAKKKKGKKSKKEESIIQIESDSDSEQADFTPKKKTATKAKRVLHSSSDEEKQKKENGKKQESSTESDASEKEKNKKKRRRRIKAVKDDEDSSNDEQNESGTRKHIRKVMKEKSLKETTIQAEKEEAERKKRITERQKYYNDIFNMDPNISTKVDKLVLDFDEETKEELLSVHPKMLEHLKPHQAAGVKFMWDACFESFERMRTHKGSGCILAHCMGLGKTLQVIAFLHTLITNSQKTKVKTALVVCPLSTVLNWQAEFDKWQEGLGNDVLDVYNLIYHKKGIERMYQINDWQKGGGVMILGYDMFRIMANPKSKGFSKKCIAAYQKGLVDPGPDIVICDEGHLLKNEKTSISKAMNQIKSLKRIVLTGTPLQNNLKEYYCMIQFVKPNLLGTYREYTNRFVNPITNGQFTDSTPADVALMRKRSHVLHKMLDGIVQRKDYSVLAPYLPPKHEYVLFLKLTPLQISLYQKYMECYARRLDTKGSAVVFKDHQALQRICTHPRVLLDKSIEDKEKRLLDSDSEGSLADFINDDDDDKSTTSNDSGSKSSCISAVSGASKKRKIKTRQTRRNAKEDNDDSSDCEIIEKEEKEWWQEICSEEDLDNIKNSSKLMLLFEILHQCEQMGDKILVFSQSLYSLNVIEYFLEKIDEACQNKQSCDNLCNYASSWSLGVDYFRIDGSSSCDNRNSWCKVFNDEENTRARLFLISTKAGGLGINLVAANRVIIFDCSWNPSHDIQSIYRVYRFGQKKPCYIYRFVTLNAMEHRLYERQVTKQAISKRVIDEQQIDRHYNQNDLAELYKYDLEPKEPRETPILPKDRLFADLLQSREDIIYNYHEHESLLENKQEEELDEEERKAAWEEYENEKKNLPRPGLVGTTGITNVGTAFTVAEQVECIRDILHLENAGMTMDEISQKIPIVYRQLLDSMQAGNFTIYNRLLQYKMYKNSIMKADKVPNPKAIQMQNQQPMQTNNTQPMSEQPGPQVSREP